MVTGAEGVASAGVLVQAPHSDASESRHALILNVYRTPLSRPVIVVLVAVDLTR